MTTEFSPHVRVKNNVERFYDYFTMGNDVIEIKEEECKKNDKFFQFHAVFGKIWQSRPKFFQFRKAPPPRGNPGSATPETQHKPDTAKEPG